MRRNAFKIASGFAFLFAALAAMQARAAVPEVAQAETTVSLDAGVMHTQYHENLLPGDDENGYAPGFGVGASALLPLKPGWNPDLYTALNYAFNAGDLHYGGHYSSSGAPSSATDNAVFNRIEAKIGFGYQFPDYGIELIPYFAAGYQAWNRNINNKGVVGTDEFYHAALVGGGLRLDLPLTPVLVASFDGEVLGVFGGGVRANNFNSALSFGPSGEQRATFRLDDAIAGRVHVFGTLFWEHFNYSGSRSQTAQIGDDLYSIREPLSVTQQFGANIGIAYSFY